MTCLFHDHPNPSHEQQDSLPWPPIVYQLLHLLSRIKSVINFVNGKSISIIRDGVPECHKWRGNKYSKINPKPSSSYLIFLVSKSTTMSLNIDRWSSKDPRSVMRWEYKYCFRCNLLVRPWVMHNCSNFNHYVATYFPFITSWKNWFERRKCICDRAFRFLRCFLSNVKVTGILLSLIKHHSNLIGRALSHLNLSQRKFGVTI